MKTKKITLLFYYLIFLGLTNSFAQVNQDSLKYYQYKVDTRTANANELARAYILFDKIKTWYLDEGQVLWGVYYLDRMSEIENLLGWFYDSENTAVQALKLLDSLPVNPDHIAYRNRLVNRIGMILWDYRRYDESLDYNFKLLKVVQTRSDSATVFNNIGITYKLQEKYDSARFYLEKAYGLSMNLRNKPRILARSLDNLGFVQGMLNDEEGLVNMKKALEMRKLDSTNIHLSYNHLTEFYLLKENKEEALIYAKKAYDHATQRGSKYMQRDALRNLLKLGKNYADEFFHFDDILSREEQLNKNKFAKIKYDYSKAETEKERERSKRIIYQAFGILATLIFISVTLILRSRHKKNVLIKQFETEQYISKKLHDEVANDVFHTITKVRGDKTDSPELLDALDGIYHKVRDISKSNADLDVSKDFGRLLNDLLDSYKTERVNILTKNASKVVWSELSEAKRKVLYRVLQELMINMKKHSKATLITLNFEKDKGKLSVHYIDNGVGCTLEKGSGLTNTESRMEMIGGAITFESAIGKGFRAHLIL